MLVAAVRSVLSQDADVAEVLVIDDCSSDGSGEAVDGMDSRVRVLQGAGKGPAAARNLGAEAARGELLAFLDADDEWLPHSLEPRLELLRRNQRAVLAFSDAELVDRLDRPLGLLHQDRAVIAGRIYPALLLDNFLPTSSVVVRAEAFRDLEHGFQQDFQPCEDYRLWLRLAAAGPCELEPRPLVRRRLRRAGFGADYLASITAQSAVLEDSLAADGRADLATWQPLRQRLVVLHHVRGQLLARDGQREQALAAYDAARNWGDLGLRLGWHAWMIRALYPLARRLVSPRRLGVEPLP